MKTNKIFSALFLFLIQFSFTSNASDLVVEEFGTAPAYSSINAAVTAAVDGDRILIRNRAGNIPWIENINISKSLELLSYDNDTFFVVQGLYTLDAAAGRNITIIGMKNLSGGITAGNSTGANKACNVNIFDSYFTLGNISLNANVFNTTIAGCSILNGIVRINSGSIIGNTISNLNNGNTEAVSIINTSGFQNDTVYVIGNKIKNAYTGTTALYCQSTASIMHIKNNYVIHSYIGIYIFNCANTALTNYIFNNTIWVENYNFSNYGIYLGTLPAASITEVMNNVVDGNASGTKYGIYASGVQGQANAYFNHVEFNFFSQVGGNFTFAGNNTTNLSVSFNTSTGILNAGDASIDGGNPANPFYDLDLTPGDAGAYGGSFTLNNFFPLHSGAARIYSVTYPFNIRSGNTLNVKASAFDR